MAFNDDNFMLKNEAAKRLYQQIKDQPIFDYHCHLDPKEIFEDKVYDNIVDLWLGGDHYKWRLMRANGISEEEITGSASKLDKFKAFARTLQRSYGNPVYHWSAMELKNVFGVCELLTEDNAEEIYHRINAYLVEHQISPRKLIADSRVRFIGTTDHPLDDLAWHKRLAADDTFETVVAPTFRPDEAFIEHQRFADFVARLAQATGRTITDFKSFIAAMEERIAYFAENGCKASDISFTEIVFEAAEPEQLDHLMTRVLEGYQPQPLEIKQWQTAVFAELCRLYKHYGFVTQVHFGALRNNHSAIFNKLGADVGVDSLGDQTGLAINMNRLLDHLVQRDSLPKMIWYNLNPSYNIAVANTLANFQANENGIAGYLQFGAGWWFADTKLGMISQMNALAEQGLLANFVGMLTDSRSFLSYQRHDYFRRILSTYLGEWIEEGEVPEDYQALGKMAQDIAYNNAIQYFN
ncbi:glucuronate isomerase [Streptococcus equi]|uniref:glucuronate isomerase n=1 Tax=Streptococcus equi TaxID=1336 RepID=UPI0018CAF267|nr:glucuronate isomerase [Streptococcus equi]MCD3396930.1 glucuronate isomerase [Streptococcus equi subsp. zooepidemicus]MCD3427408.1 glucuronate isomerase [Streptococcus equi subsp. zooepidemicus]QTC11942.1 Uronate isomerase [Streptococcus equi subsp. zooepidemicus]HEL0015216.1 glucuronate isomerase [Streptococcus equi subsp. zooepidemicus]HEL0566153.1 glucuronate isomerase [Streptococcus equi subsp. zooepidemicus]